MRACEVEHGQAIADRAEAVWNWASPAGRRRARRRARLVAEAARLGPEMGVLELGCGTGLFTQQFALSGCRLVAVDIAPALLERAAARSFGRHVEIRLEDAESLSFADGTFDAVIGSSILHHLDLDRALVELHRVLKPTGRIAFAEPNMMNPQIAAQRTIPWLRRWAGETPEETAFFRWSLAAKLRDFGFTDVAIEPFDFLHPATPRSLIGAVRRVGSVLEKLPGVREVAGSLLIRACRPAVCTRGSRKRAAGARRDSRTSPECLVRAGPAREGHEGPQSSRPARVREGILAPAPPEKEVLR